MSELPANMNDWPDDPYELLGVARGVQARDLKKAYTQLIRIYKPEQFPEQFRKIRDAYETVLRFVQWFGAAEEAAPAEAGAGESAASADARSDLPGWQATPSRVDELSALWQQASRGEDAAAYRRLVELAREPDGQADVCLRLYWLLVLNPELDPQRSPCDWLVQGLTASGLGGALRELYRRELADNPEEAFSARSEKLLDLPVNPTLLAELADWRLQAAGRLSRWQAIADDLARLRPRFVPDGDEAWVRLLLTAADQLALCLDPEGFKLLMQCKDEIAKFEYLGDRIADELDRFEFNMGMAMHWRKLRKMDKVPRPLLEVLALSISRPFAEIRLPLQACLQDLVARPWASVRLLELIEEHAADVLGHLGNLFNLYQNTLPDEAADGQPRQDAFSLVQDFFAEAGGEGYQLLRGRLLSFCMQEMIAPETIASMLEPDLANLVLRDKPLRYICWADRLFRA